jgi:hypothetical protein
VDALRSPPNTPVCRAPCRTATTDKIALFSNSVQKEVVSYVRSREMITTIRKVKWYMTCEMMNMAQIDARVLSSWIY